MVARRTILAVEGGSFSKGGGEAPVVFLLTRGTKVQDLEVGRMTVDGLDGTERVLEFLGGHAGVDVLMSGSVPIAGFNLIDPREILLRGGVPSVFVLEAKPDREAVLRALRRHFADWQKRIDILDGAGEAHEFVYGGKRFVIECTGIEAGEALELADRLAVFGNVPEPIRLARMIARTISSLGRPWAGGATESAPREVS